MTGRECGECSLCCKLLTVPGVPKVDHQWCAHCRPGKGCQIQATKPETCSGYSCLWLAHAWLGEEWKPSRSKIIVNFADAESPYDLSFIVDPAHPSRWREEPFYSLIRKQALAGLTSGVVGHDGVRFGWTTNVRIGKRCVTIGPYGEEWDAPL